MKAIRRLDQYLRLRGDIWHYVRRVPKAVRHIDDRTLIYRSLDTDSRKVARQRRDICADEDNQLWNELMPNRFQSTPRDASYRDASHQARSKGFNYVPMESLVSQNTVTDLLRRLIALEPLKDRPQRKEERDPDGLLGSVKTPSATITEAMDLYLSEIVADELSSKSPEQVTNFSKIKRRAVANFVNLNGDIDMRDITREHAHAVRKFHALTLSMPGIPQHVVRALSAWLQSQVVRRWPVKGKDLSHSLINAQTALGIVAALLRTPPGQRSESCSRVGAWLRGGLAKLA